MGDLVIMQDYIILIVIDKNLNFFLNGETCANRRGCTWALQEESSNTRIGFGL